VGNSYVTEEQQRSSSLVGDPYIVAEQQGAATSTSTLVGDHYVAEQQQRPVASATMSGGGGYRRVSTSTPGCCSDVISASQVEQLMDSLQHIVATDDGQPGCAAATRTTMTTGQPAMLCRTGART